MTGRRNNSNWEEYPQRFVNLIRAISESDIKNSLEDIYFQDCGITIKEAENI